MEGLNECAFSAGIIIRGSSNGRTPGFGPGYRGSNPCPRAREKQSIKMDCFSLFVRRDLNGCERGKLRAGCCQRAA